MRLFQLFFILLCLVACTTSNPFTFIEFTQALDNAKVGHCFIKNEEKDPFFR